MLKKLAVFLIILSVASISFADNFTASIAGGGYFPLRQYISVNGESSQNESYSKMLGDVNWVLDASFAYSVTDLFEVGATLAMESGCSDYTDTLFTYPVYVDIAVTPSIENITFPFTLSAGGFGQIRANLMTFGLALRLSAAIEIGITDWMDFFAKAYGELLFAFPEDGVYTYYNLSPVMAGLQFRF